MSTHDTAALGKVAVLFGGSSAEREISIMSGSAVLAALQEQGVDAHAFDPAERDLWELKRDGFDRAFIALHGRGGEDGTIQGALECLGIPYTGSGVMASAIGMDKWRTKMVWLSAGLPTPRYKLLHAGSDFRAVANELGLPLFVKPAREGSSVGATKVTRIEDLEGAYEKAARCDPLVLAEQFISGRELTAPFLGDMALPLIRIEAPQGNYDYQNKYFTDDVKYHCPSGLDADLEQEIQDLVMRAARLIDCRGWGRADLMLGEDGRPWLLEINTSPGMTSHSLVPMAARSVGIEFGELCLRILESARLG
ncbi:D-alanine--D-alanine ligase [Methyloversatilis discipulorum]|jgi:D-alanine-D-alanine ligase|uniref:D-alanine--D-alanine ligase n=1 Tax=Methyloversatilis discipulorum TaxID=1119528 RepID=UPI001A3E4A54|nr:D-alanine--D-alanine ligase [Methyloversatilis discipulorum]MBL8469722.1 D-alanine--D-alanine ligase [Methyloversatilis discipulorum]